MINVGAITSKLNEAKIPFTHEVIYPGSGGFWGERFIFTTRARALKAAKALDVEELYVRRNYKHWAIEYY